MNTKKKMIILSVFIIVAAVVMLEVIRWEGDASHQVSEEQTRQKGKSSRPEPKKNTFVPKEEAKTDGSYKWEDCEGGIKITDYKGTDRELVIPEMIDEKPVVLIGQYAFDESDTLEHVTIPASIQVVGAFSFQGCKSLKGLVLESPDTKLIPTALDGCMAIEDIKMPKENKVILLVGTSLLKNTGMLSNIERMVNVGAPRDVLFSIGKNLSLSEIWKEREELDINLETCLKVADIVIFQDNYDEFPESVMQKMCKLGKRGQKRYIFTRNAGMEERMRISMRGYEFTEISGLSVIGKILEEGILLNSETFQTGEMSELPSYVQGYFYSLQIYNAIYTKPLKSLDLKEIEEEVKKAAANQQSEEEGGDVKEIGGEVEKKIKAGRKLVNKMAKKK